MEPTLEGYVAFIRDMMGIIVSQLPADSIYIPLTYNVALQTVNLGLDLPSCGVRTDPTQPSIYALAVYNLAGDRLLNWAQDPTGAPVFMDGMAYFKYIRKTLNLNGLVPGVIQSTNNLTTGGSYVVPEWAKNLTIGDINNLKTPYGQQYIAFAQDYGPTDWGIS